MLVSNAQETFQLDFVRINSKLDVPQGLVEEIKNFGAKKTASGRSKYEAMSGKDDQVNAMMLALYLIYILLETKNKMMEYDMYGSSVGKPIPFDDWVMQQKREMEQDTTPSYNIFW